MECKNDKTITQAISNDVIGIVILNYKTWQKTIECVDSVIKTHRHRHKIVVVDNQSPNDSMEQLQRAFQDNLRYADVVIVQSPMNGGFSYGNNYGVRTLISLGFHDGYCVLVNNDVVFMDCAIDIMRNVFSRDEKIAVVGPMIYDSAGRSSNPPMRTDQSFLQYLELKSRRNVYFAWDEMADFEYVYLVCGCCFMIDIAKFIEIDMLDESVFLYNEEGILSKKVQNYGYKMGVDKTAGVIHAHSSTTGSNIVFVDAEMAKSGMYYSSIYEGGGCFKVACLCLFYCIKIIVKRLLNRYASRDNVGKYIKDIFHTYIRVVRSK